MESQLAEFSGEIAKLVDRVSRGVVAVHGRRRTHSSGVHWRKGLIATAEHTLRRDEDITVTAPDGQTLQANLVGRDPGTDLAVLKVEGIAEPEADLTGNTQPRTGDLSFVIGRSPNSGPNVTMGVISAVSGPWRTWRGGQLDSYIRLGAEVFAGSSGGAVIDHRGNIVGIATSALSRVAGLAIPASNVNRVVDLLLTKGAIPRPFLGVGLQSIQIPEAFRQKLSLKNSSGLMVLTVEEGSPAGTAGMLVGDILYRIDGADMEEIDDLQSFLTVEKIGARVEAQVIRGGEARKLAIQVGERGGKAEQ